MCVARLPPVVMAESIIAELHGRLLRGIAAETSVHYQGLRAAASHLRRTGLLDSRLAKKLAAVDVAFAISRHITVVSAEQCVSEVLSAIAHGVKAAAERKVSLEGTAEEEVTKKDTDLDQVEVDKLAEAEAATKEKYDLEQAATKKAIEEMVQVAIEKLAVEKAAEQKVMEEMAAKTILEQAVKAKAAEKVKADAEIAARVKKARLLAESRVVEAEKGAEELLYKVKAEVAAVSRQLVMSGTMRTGPQLYASKVAGDEQVAEAAELAKAMVAAAKKAADVMLEEALLGESAFKKARGVG